MDHPLIALMTDFGPEDFFVPSLKGVILSMNPEARLVDISHSIRSFDIRSAAFLLQACFRFFPKGTIFLCVVDPGVGSPRRLLTAETECYVFVGPDNGLLAMALAVSGECRVRVVTETRYFLTDQPTTFEGRDRMAPLAAWLSLGVRPAEFGPLVEDFVSLPLPKAYVRSGEIIGHVSYIDKFGNVITDIPAAMLPPTSSQGKSPGLSLSVREKTITAFRNFYNQGGRRELFVVVGSLGLLEISMREGSAASELGTEVGDVAVLRSGA